MFLHTELEALNATVNAFVDSLQIKLGCEVWFLFFLNDKKNYNIFLSLIKH